MQFRVSLHRLGLGSSRLLFKQHNYNLWNWKWNNFFILYIFNIFILWKVWMYLFTILMHVCTCTCGLRHCHNKYILCTASYKTLCRNVCDFPNNFKWISIIKKVVNTCVKRYFKYLSFNKFTPKHSKNHHHCHGVDFVCRFTRHCLAVKG